MVLMKGYDGRGFVFTATSPPDGPRTRHTSQGGVTVSLKCRAGWYGSGNVSPVADAEADASGFTTRLKQASRRRLG